MRKCKYCGSEIIDDKEIKCPYCNKYLISKNKVFVILVLMIIITQCWTIVRFVYKNNKAFNNHNKNIEQINEYRKNSNQSIEEYNNIWYKVEEEIKTDTSYEITGYILNKNDKPVTNVTISFLCYDENNYILDVIKDNVSVIESNNLWKYKLRYDGKADRCVYYNLEVNK